MWPLVFLSYACALRSAPAVPSLAEVMQPAPPLALIEPSPEDLRRAELWVKSRGGEVGTEFHRVRDGETIGSIADEHGRMPLWVIRTYNPASDLEDLRPGQRLMMPLLADAVSPHADF